MGFPCRIPELLSCPYLAPYKLLPKRRGQCEAAHCHAPTLGRVELADFYLRTAIYMAWHAAAFAEAVSREGVQFRYA